LTRDDLGRASSVSDTDGDDLESRLIRVARSGRAIADVRGALAGAERAARIAVAEASVATLAEVGALVDAYEQLLRAFADLGIAPAAPIGGELAPTELDSRLHKIAGEASSRYVVREAGLVVDGEVLVPAIVEGAPE
jgi:hypothetical protein